MRLLAPFFFVCFLAACGVPGMASCSEQAKPFLDQLQPIAREWDDAAKLASQSPRMSLPTQIEKLQGIRRKAQDLTPPECAAAAKGHLIGAMDATIQAYFDFLSQKNDTTVKASFEKAGKEMTAYSQALVAIYAPPTPVP